MSATIEQRQLVQSHREQAYVDYERNRRFEEITDIAERIGHAIDTTITYQRRGDAVYALTDMQHRPFHEQTAAALQRGALYTGDQAFERTRLQHEHDEALMVDALARGELAGNVLVKISPVPDAVVRGETGIKGYRRDLLRSFVRIYRRDNDKVHCRLFSLDHNDVAGMQAVGQLLGINVADKTSEDILGSHQLIDVPTDQIFAFVDGLAASVKRTYDMAIYERTGQKTRAGSLLASDRDAHSLVASHARLIDEHMQTLGRICQTGVDSDGRIERERQCVAAAISLTLRGVQVASSADGAVSSEVENGNYNRECATVANGMNQSQNYNQDWKFGSCRVCLRDMLVGGCSVCAICEAADNRGESLRRRHEQAVARRREIAERARILDQRVAPVKQPQLTKQQIAEMKYGQYAMAGFELQIGGAKMVAINKHTRQSLGDI